MSQVAKSAASVDQRAIQRRFGGRYRAFIVRYSAGPRVQRSALPPILSGMRRTDGTACKMHLWYMSSARSLSLKVLAMDIANLPPSSESDDLLRQRLMLRLQQRNYVSHRRLRIDVEDGVVIVQGRLPSYFLRQVAIECLKHAPGVARVEDRIKVGDGIEVSDISDQVAGVEASPGSRRFCRMEKQTC